MPPPNYGASPAGFLPVGPQLPPTPYAGPGPGVDARPGAGMCPGGMDIPPLVGPDADDDGAPSGDEHGNKDKSKKSTRRVDWQPLYGGCGPGWYIDGDYLSMRYKNLPVTVPLLTTGPVTSPPTSGFGILNNPGTQLLFPTGGPNPEIGLGYTPGARVTIGGWTDGGYHLPGCPAIGLEASYLTLGRVATHFEASSNAFGLPLLARPVVDATTDRETVLLVSAPASAGGPAGSFKVDTSTELWGAEANAFMPFFGWHHVMLGGMAGFRYINFEEGLQIDQQSKLLSNGIAFLNGVTIKPPATLNIFDDFQTRNNFYGGQVGAQLAVDLWRFTFSGQAKIALGTMHEQVEILGTTTVSKPPLGRLSTPGGILALPSNSGDFGQYEFAIVPEATGKVSLQITNNINVSVGWTFMYMNNVQRPGNLIDRNVNPAQLPSSQSWTPLPAVPPVPAFSFVRSDFWVQGLTLGLGLAF
jgi:hypothetical protein